MVLARAVLLPQVVVAGVADVPVAQGEVPAPALDQAAVGAHGQDAAGQALSRLIASSGCIKPLFRTRGGRACVRGARGFQTLNVVALRNLESCLTVRPPQDII